MVMRWSNAFSALFALLAAALMLGCASNPTSLDAQWVNPAFAGKRSVNSVMVMGSVRDSTNRRLFEDRMVETLAGMGIKAVQSYRFIPEEGPYSSDRVRQAVAQAGVGYAMVTRIINVSTDVNVTPGMVMGPAWGPGWGGPGWGTAWGPGWGGFGAYSSAMWVSTPPTVTTTQNVHADTRLFEAQNAEVLWSAATTTSLGYSSVPQILNQFVQLITTAMAKDGVI